MRKENEMTNQVSEKPKSGAVGKHTNGYTGSARKNALQRILSRVGGRSSSVDFTQTTIGEMFGSYVFDRQVMRKMLPKNVYKAVVRCLDQGEPLDPRWLTS